MVTETCFEVEKSKIENGILSGMPFSMRGDSCFINYLKTV